MGKIKPLGVVLGLAGNVMIGVALFHLIQTGSCGGVGQPACPAEVVPYLIALPVGITLSVVAIFLGGGALIFGGTFLAVGLGSMAAGAFGDNDETRTFGWIFGGMFAFFGVLPVAGAFLMLPVRRAKMARMQQLLDSGAEGVGTVVDVRDTGVTINDDPRVDVRMRVEPTDGSRAFEAEKTVTVSRVAIPRVGDRFPVWYDPAEPTTWAYGVDVDETAPPGVRALFARAQAQASPAPAPAPAGDVAFNAPTTGSPLDELSRLNDLRMKGALTDEEFQVAKDRILARLGGGPDPGP